MSFHRLIRFHDKEGVERYGDAEDEISPSELKGRTVKLVSGNIESGFKITEEKALVTKVG